MNGDALFPGQELQGPHAAPLAAPTGGRARLLAVVAVLAAGLGLYFGFWRSSQPSGTTGRASSLAVARFHLGGAPVGVATARGSLWVVLESGVLKVELVKLDPHTGRQLASYAIGRTGPDFGAVTSIGDVIWATAGDHVIRVDASHPGTTIRRMSLPGEGSSITVGYGSVWVASIGQDHNTISRLNAATLAPQAHISLTIQPVAIRAGLGSVWVASTSGLWKLGPTTDRLTPIPVPVSLPVDLALSGGRLWVIQQTALITGIDRDGRVRAEISLPFSPGAIAASPAHLWVTTNCGCMTGSLAVVDIRSRHVITRRPIGETPVALAPTSTGVWVATFSDGSISQVTLSR